MIFFFRLKELMKKKAKEKLEGKGKPNDANNHKLLTSPLGQFTLIFISMSTSLFIVIKSNFLKREMKETLKSNKVRE